MRAAIWQPVDGIVGPCADMSFSYSGRDRTFVTMHFSHVKDLPENDLTLDFRGAVAMKWELECPGFNEMPQDLPKCRDPKWQMWTFPLLQVEDSSWLQQFKPIYEHPQGSKLAHFLLVSMNDLVQLIANAEVGAKWIVGYTKT
jgi:hypothetical protein